MLSHRKGVLLDGIGSELVRSSAGGRRKTLSSWLGAAGDMTVTATGGDTLTLAEWFKRMSRGTAYPDVAYGYHTDRSANGDTAFPLRIQDRLFLGVAATGEEGATIASGHDVTWVSSSFDHYLARSAHLFSISPSGGAGGVFATRRSDVYDGNAVWTSGEAVTIGAVRGYLGGGSHNLYTATTSGTTGATPPTHTSGTASDGAVTWQFTQIQYRTAMAFATLAWNNVADGGPGWGGYIEAVRDVGAGFTIGLEIDVKNAGSNVQIGPYSMNTAGGSAALWLAAGPTQYGPSAANPVSAALGVISNGSTTFHKGFVFESGSLTDEGGSVYRAINFPEDYYITQYTTAGAVGSSISFTCSANNERVSQVFDNRAIKFLCQGQQMGAFVSDVAAGTAPDDYIVLAAQASASGFVQIRPNGTTTNVTLSLSSKGAADTHILREDSSTNTAPHVLSVRRRSSGTPATGIGGALTFDTETAADNMEIGGKISSIFTSVTSTAEVADMLFSVMTGGASADRLRLTPTALQPETDQQITLGTSSKSFGNVFAGGKAMWRTIAASAVQIVRSSVNGAGDATETAQVTVAIPAGAMGANGRLRITFMGTCTNSANAKTWTIRYGASGAGTGGQSYYSVAATSQASTQVQLMIRNVNSESSQKGYSTAVAASFGQTTNATKTSAINSASATEVVISNAWAGATSAEAMNVEDYLVEVLYQA